VLQHSLPHSLSLYLTSQNNGISQRYLHRLYSLLSQTGTLPLLSTFWGLSRNIIWVLLFGNDWKTKSVSMVYHLGLFCLLMGFCQWFIILIFFGRAWGGMGISKNRATGSISGNRVAGLLWGLLQRKSHSTSIQGLHYRPELISLPMLLALLLVLGVTSSSYSSSYMLLRIVDICNSVFIICLYYAKWAAVVFKIERNLVGLIKLVSLAFGLKLVILDKLKLWYGIWYVYPLGTTYLAFCWKLYVGSVLK